MTLLETAEMHKQDAAEIKESSEIKSDQLMADYHKTMIRLAEETNDGILLENHRVGLDTCLISLGLVEAVEIDEDSLVESYTVLNGGQHVITAHSVVGGVPVSQEATTVVSDKGTAKDLGLNTEADSKPVRMSVTDRKSGKIAHFHVTHVGDSNNNPVYHVRIAGKQEPHSESHMKILKDHMSSRIVEEVIVENNAAYDSWKNEIEQTHPQHRGTVRYVGFNDPIHGACVNAHVPGEDKSLGVYTLSKDSGHVLTEAKETHFLFGDAPRRGTEKYNIWKSKVAEFNNSTPPKETEYHYGAQKVILKDKELSEEELVEAEDNDSSDYRVTASGHKARAKHVRHKSESDANKNDDKKQEESFQMDEATKWKTIPMGHKDHLAADPDHPRHSQWLAAQPPQKSAVAKQKALPKAIDQSSDEVFSALEDHLGGSFEHYESNPKHGHRKLEDGTIVPSMNATVTHSYDPREDLGYDDETIKQFGLDQGNNKYAETYHINVFKHPTQGLVVIHGNQSLNESADNISVGSRVHIKDNIGKEPLTVVGVHDDQQVHVRDEFGQTQKVMLSDLVPHRNQYYEDDEENERMKGAMASVSDLERPLRKIGHSGWENYPKKVEDSIDDRWQLYAENKETGYTVHHIPFSQTKPGEMRFKHQLDGKTIISDTIDYPEEFKTKWNESAAQKMVRALVEDDIQTLKDIGNTLLDIKARHQFNEIKKSLA